jgi:hypothetical protein
MHALSFFTSLALCLVELTAVKILKLALLLSFLLHQSQATGRFGLLHSCYALIYK